MSERERATTAVAEPWDLGPAPIDPFRARSHGCYVDDAVTVGHFNVGAQLGSRTVDTPSFHIWWDCRLHVRHRFTDGDIDDSLTERINAELFEPGWVGGNQIFERIFTGIVLSMRTDPAEAWALFYRNTRDQLQRAADDPAAVPPRLRDLAEFGAIYRRTDELVPKSGSVLEVGSCFGFQALHLAGRLERRVIASDISTSSMQLLDTMSRRLGVRLETRVLDARRLSVPDRSVDTVVQVHLLEHLEATEGAIALAEACRVARKRVIVALPWESEPNAAYGHVRTVSHADLVAWGESAEGWTASVTDFHGGWLVLDRID